MKLGFDFDKIRFATDQSTLKKAIALYEGGKIKGFEESPSSCLAIVSGTEDYHVSIETRRFGYGYCDCYMGQKDYFCKHMVALAIKAVLGDQPIPSGAAQASTEPRCSGKKGELSKLETAETKKAISNAMRYIKAYSGPSRTWFAYQASLSEGCSRLSAIVSALPVCTQTAELIVKTLLRLDKKLCTGGVDDSDGTVGGFIEACVGVLMEFASLEVGCIDKFGLLCDQSTCFGWEDDLVRMYDERQNM